MGDQKINAAEGRGGWTALVERLRNFSIAVLGLEASSGRERGVARALLAAGMSVRQINLFKRRQFATASGVLTKNDVLDARMISSFVAIMRTRPAQRQAPADWVSDEVDRRFRAHAPASRYSSGCWATAL
jgi:transposase